MAELAPEIRELFEKANYGHLATIMPDGSPASVAVWVGMEGDRIVFFTQPWSPKARNVAADPRVAISVIDRDNPYRTGRIRGRVVATRDGDAALEVIDRLARKFTGRDFPMRSGIVYEIEADHSGYMELPFEEPATPNG
jgi:PPOX class probable F420-dependent enzyme